MTFNTLFPPPLKLLTLYNKEESLDTVFTVEKSNPIGSNKGAFTREEENLFSQEAGTKETSIWGKVIRDDNHIIPAS